MLCPQCESVLVERKFSRSLFDSFCSAFSFYPIQCQACQYRFRRFAGRLGDRNADRIPVRIPVRFEWGEGRGEGTITDISVGGCALESNRELRPGLLLRLYIPVGTDEPANRTAQQLVCVRSVNGDRAGVKFLAYTPQEQLQLTETITTAIRIFTNK